MTDDIIQKLHDFHMEAKKHLHVVEATAHPAGAEWLRRWYMQEMATVPEPFANQLMGIPFRESEAVPMDMLMLTRSDGAMVFVNLSQKTAFVLPKPDVESFVEEVWKGVTKDLDERFGLSDEPTRIKMDYFADLYGSWRR